MELRTNSKGIKLRERYYCVYYAIIAKVKVKLEEHSIRLHPAFHFFWEMEPCGSHEYEMLGYKFSKCLYIGHLEAEKNLSHNTIDSLSSGLLVPLILEVEFL